MSIPQDLYLRIASVYIYLNRQPCTPVALTRFPTLLLVIVSGIPFLSSRSLKSRLAVVKGLLSSTTFNPAKIPSIVIILI